jgi:hypothetical protein
MFLEGFDGFVASTAAPIATGWSDPVAGRELHPLKIHALSRRTNGFARRWPSIRRIGFGWSESDVRTPSNWPNSHTLPIEAELTGSVASFGRTDHRATGVELASLGRNTRDRRVGFGSSPRSVDWL